MIFGTGTAVCDWLDVRFSGVAAWRILIGFRLPFGCKFGPIPLDFCADDRRAVTFLLCRVHS
jgi:hypothetical protein